MEMLRDELYSYLDPRTTSLETEVPGGDRFNGLLLVDTGVARSPTPKSAFDKGARRTDNNRFWATVHLLNFTFGSIILNTGQVFRRSGIVAASLLYMIAGTAIYLSEILLVLAAEVLSLEDAADAPPLAVSGSRAKDSGASIDELEYTVVARRTLGWRGAKAVDAFIFLQDFGACLSYLILIGGLATSVISEWAETDESGALVRLWYSFYFVMPAMVVLFVIPPCLIRHFSNIRWLAVFSLSTVSAVALLVVARSPSYAQSERSSSDADAALSAAIQWWNWRGAMTKIGSILLSANCTPAVFHTYSSMENRTGSEWRRVVRVSLTLGIVIYYVTGLTAYLSFRAATEGDILDNFEGMVASCFKILMVIHLLVYIPSEFVILRHSAFALVDDDVMTASFPAVLGVTLAIYAFLMGIIIGLMLGGIAESELFGDVVDLTGGIASSMVGMVLPGLIYLEATRGIHNRSSVRWYRWGCYILVALGILPVIAVPMGLVLNTLGYE